jgi:hypothetical protein
MKNEKFGFRGKMYAAVSRQLVINFLILQQLAKEELISRKKHSGFHFREDRSGRFDIARNTNIY